MLEAVIAGTQFASMAGINKATGSAKEEGKKLWYVYDHLRRTRQQAEDQVPQKGGGRPEPWIGNDLLLAHAAPVPANPPTNQSGAVVGQGTTAQAGNHAPTTASKGVSFSIPQFSPDSGGPRKWNGPNIEKRWGDRTFRYVRERTRSQFLLEAINFLRFLDMRSGPDGQLISSRLEGPTKQPEG